MLYNLEGLATTMSKKSYLEKVGKPAKLKLKLKIISKFFALVQLRMRTIEDCSDFYSTLITAISRSGGYEVYRLASVTKMRFRREA